MSEIQLDRESELPQLRDEVYLDNAGAGLPLKSHLKRFSEDLIENMYGNPHSLHTHSDRTGKIVEGVREEIASFLRTDLSQYSVLFTAGTTSACKLVADSFCWGRGSGEGVKGDGEPAHVYLSSEQTEFRENCQVLQGAVDTKRSCYLYLEINHTSVVGMREVAKDKGAISVWVKEADMFEEVPTSRENSVTDSDEIGLGDTKIDVLKLLQKPTEKDKTKEIFVRFKKEYSAKEEQVRKEGFHLLAHPATCNFSGKKYPIGMVERKSRSGVNICGVNFPPNSVKVFIDAAAALSSSEIDLSKNSPHFLAVSFYKLFGFPTGIGALLVRNDSCHLLSKKYFGGGTVWSYTSRRDFHFRKDLVQDFYEEGTISYQSILALSHGFETLKTLGLSMARISSHVFSLVEYAYSQLRALKHYNGAPVLELYTSSPDLDPTTQGHILSFNILRPDGGYVGYIKVNEIANMNKISLRVGCFCNGGACQKYMSVTDEQVIEFLEAGHLCGDEIDLVNGVPTGAVRASFGFYNTREDADRLVSMIKRNFLESQLNGPVTVSKEDSSVKEGLRVTEISIYPIKSCGGMKVTKWPLCETGFLYDRKWAILDSRKELVNQTMDKNLYRIQPLIDLESGSMRLSYPGMEPISINLRDGDNASKIVRRRIYNVRILEVNHWLSQALGYPVTLTQGFDTNGVSRVAYSNEFRMTSQYNTRFFLTTQASARTVVELAKKKDGKIYKNPQDLIDSIQGNVVVDGKGMQAFEEYKWRRISINGVTMTHFRDSTNNGKSAALDNELKNGTIESANFSCVNLEFDLSNIGENPLISVGDGIIVYDSV